MNGVLIDSDLTAVLAELGPAAPVAEQSVDELRQGLRDAIHAFTRGAAEIPVAQISDERIRGRGGMIPVRVYAPEQPVAVIVYLHGGGWMVGDVDTHDLVTRRISRDTGAIVVSVDYRLVPEHPYPAQIDDAYDATVWASALRPDLPLLVAGDSAGGTLAACIALLARDDSGPRIDGQVLVYPAVDDDLNTPSMTVTSDDPRITRDDVRFFLAAYAGHGPAMSSPYALPARAASLEGLPPAVVVIAGHDVLRSSEETYATRLQDAGVPVTVQLDLELGHGWVDYAPLVPAADRAFSRLIGTINDLIHRGTTPA